MKKFLEDTLYWLAAHDDAFFQILIGFMLAAVGLFTSYYVGRSAQLHCERTGANQVACSITQKVLGIQPLSERQVNLIQRAVVDESFDSNGDATYRVVFNTPNGREPLTKSFSSDYAPKADLVQQVNKFIDTDQGSVLEVQEKIAWWIWLIFFGFTGLGVGMMLVSLKKYLR
jgi:preprotein translocase subunit SecF